MVEERYAEAAEAARASIWSSPGDLYSWHALGRIEYARTEPDAWPRQALPLPLAEDPAWAELLARPASIDLDLDATLPDPEAMARLRAAAAILIEENTRLATRLEPLRRQHGYRVDAFETNVKYSYTSLHMRTLALFMHKYGAFPMVEPPPELDPALEPAFAMGGAATMERGYLNGAYPGNCLDIYTDHDLEAFQSVWQGRGMPDADSHTRASFPLMLGAADQTLQRVLSARLGAGQSVAIMESRSPAYEALCLTIGARPTSIRRTPIVNRTRDVVSLGLADWTASPIQFDAAIAVCAVEQAGLGGHGEPIDPEGDLSTMAVLRRVVRPGGLLFLSIPVGEDCVVFNATRTYGPVRLARLLEGWNRLDEHRTTDPLYHGLDEYRALFVLSPAP
jgi:hypothetical protein